MAGNQSTITGGDSNIARTGGLQAVLDSKASTTDLTSGLDGKQHIGDGDMTNVRTAGLQARTDSKKLTTVLTSGLARKQNKLSTADLSIGIVDGLQCALGSKLDDAERPPVKYLGS